MIEFFYFTLSQCQKDRLKVLNLVLEFTWGWLTKTKECSLLSCFLLKSVIYGWKNEILFPKDYVTFLKSSISNSLLKLERQHNFLCVLFRLVANLKDLEWMQIPCSLALLDSVLISDLVVCHVDSLFQTDRSLYKRYYLELELIFKKYFLSKKITDNTLLFNLRVKKNSSPPLSFMGNYGVNFLYSSNK